MKYKKMTVQEAAAAALADLPEEEGGVGGVIALDAHGNLAMPFNTGGMYRGYVTEDGSLFVGIHEQVYPLAEDNKGN
jgi:beta-aspartyl-peptidase (threonine type)